MPESGDWIGFYAYGDSQAHHTMELNLSFAGSLIAGRGIDDIGMFSINQANAICTLHSYITSFYFQHPNLCAYPIHILILACWRN